MQNSADLIEHAQMVLEFNWAGTHYDQNRAMQELLDAQRAELLRLSNQGRISDK